MTTIARLVLLALITAAALLAAPIAGQDPAPAAIAKPAPEWSIHPPTQVPTVSPIFLDVAPGVDAAWQVEHAAWLWDSLTGCELFTVDPAQPSSGTVTVRQVFDPMSVYWGHTSGSAVELNAGYGFGLMVIMHELGHVLGLDHDHEAGGLMNVDVGPDGMFGYSSAVPDQTEIAQVWAMQVDRC